MKSRRKIELIRTFIINTLAISMVAMIWIFVMDYFLHHMRRNLIVIFSVLLFSMLLGGILYFISKKEELHPVIELLLQYMAVIVLFIVFKVLFKWYEGFSIKLLVSYTLPVFLLCYGLRLIGVNKDAKRINQLLGEKQKRKETP